MYKIIYIPGDGSRSIKVFKVKKPVSRDDINVLVEGISKSVPLFHVYEGETCLAFVNSDAEHLKMPINYRGTELWSKAIDVPIDHLKNWLYGPVVIVAGKEIFGHLWKYANINHAP